MSLLDKLQEDMKQSMKARDEVRLSTIRLLRSSVSYAKIEKGSELTDDEVIEVLSREAKKRRESVEAAEKVGRDDVAQRESAELKVIEEYLPKQMDEGEIEAVVREVIAEVGATDMKDKGKVMGPLMQRVKGKADGRLVNSVVEKVLRG